MFGVDEDNECPICYYLADKTLQCGHKMCSKCYSEFRNRNIGLCGLCRRPIDKICKICCKPSLNIVCNSCETVRYILLPNNITWPPRNLPRRFLSLGVDEIVD